MNLSDTEQAIAVAIGALTLLTLLAGAVRWARPRIRAGIRRFVAAVDTIAGREAITDNITGRELAPALPSLGMRIGTLEESVSRLVEAEIERKQIDKRVTEAHDRIDAHETRLRQLEEQTIERIAAKAESVSAWRAVEAVAKQADPTTPSLPEAED